MEPWTCSSSPGCCRSSWTRSRKSAPSTVVVSAQTSPTGDEVTTYFGPWLICAATRSFGSVTSGQWPAKVSKVLRPSSSAEVCENQWSTARPQRSEEHTSELQSRGHLVCRLLLEKKK